MDRASDFGSDGWEFESLRARKKVVDDGLALVGALTVLPGFWKDSVRLLLGDLEVSPGLSSDNTGEGLGPKEVAIAETIWSLAKVVGEGRRRLDC